MEDFNERIVPDKRYQRLKKYKNLHSFYRCPLGRQKFLFSHHVCNYLCKNFSNTDKIRTMIFLFYIKVRVGGDKNTPEITNLQKCVCEKNAGQNSRRVIRSNYIWKSSYILVNISRGSYNYDEVTITLDTIYVQLSLAYNDLTSEFEFQQLKIRKSMYNKTDLVSTPSPCY